MCVCVCARVCLCTRVSVCVCVCDGLCVWLLQFRTAPTFRSKTAGLVTHKHTHTHTLKDIYTYTYTHKYSHTQRETENNSQVGLTHCSVTHAHIVAFFGGILRTNGRLESKERKVQFCRLLVQEISFLWA